MSPTKIGSPRGNIVVPAEVFAEISLHLYDARALDDVLERIAAAAVELIPGCEHAGVFLAHPRDPTHLVPTLRDDIGQVIAVIQHATGQGPCIHTTPTAERCVINDLAAEPRWPRFSRRAAQETGLASILTLPLTARGISLGALAHYARTPDAFSRDAQRVAHTLATHAALALDNALQHHQQHNQVRQLHTALQSSREIGIAIGIFMERGRYTRAQAFELLTRTSQHHNIKIRELATLLANTGALPENVTLLRAAPRQRNLPRIHAPVHSR